jgi:hypothetical protein
MLYTRTTKAIQHTHTHTNTHITTQKETPPTTFKEREKIKQTHGQNKERQINEYTRGTGEQEGIEIIAMGGVPTPAVSRATFPF